MIGIDDVQDIDLQKVKEYIEKQNWIFAKTYATRAPHEYVVRGQGEGTDEEFMEVVRYIQKEGMTMYFWNYPNKYIHVNGRNYWVMKDSDDDPTMVLNRSNADEYYTYIKWKGLPK